MDHLMKLVTTALELSYAQGEKDVSSKHLQIAAESLTLRRDAIYLLDAVEENEENKDSARDALEPFLTENAAMWDFFEAEMKKKKLSDLDTQASMQERVRSALFEMLPAGQSSIEEVANRLGMSKQHEKVLPRPWSRADRFHLMRKSWRGFGGVARTSSGSRVQTSDTHHA